jgi:hypothetical protein
MVEMHVNSISRIQSLEFQAKRSINMKKGKGSSLTIGILHQLPGISRREFFPRKD